MAEQRDSDARLDTIRALLAKAEATDYPAEAEAFVDKATELMARYSIDEAMLWADSTDDRDVPEEIHMVIERPFTAQKAVLVAGVAQAFGCRALRLGLDAQSSRELVSIVGFSSDLRLVEPLVTSLFIQLTTAMTASPNRPKNATAAQVANWRRSFIAAFASTVIARLQEARQHAATSASTAAPSPSSTTRGSGAADSNDSPAQEGPSTALVLAERESDVEADFRRRYPHIRTSRVSAGRSEAGYRAGTSAGNRADIGAGRLRGRAALPR